jgi:hypothetical protein
MRRCPDPCLCECSNHTFLEPALRFVPAAFALASTTIRRCSDTFSLVRKSDSHGLSMLISVSHQSFDISSNVALTTEQRNLHHAPVFSPVFSEFISHGGVSGCFSTISLNTFVSSRMLLVIFASSSVEHKTSSDDVVPFNTSGIRSSRICCFNGAMYSPHFSIIRVLKHIIRFLRS